MPAFGNLTGTLPAVNIRRSDLGMVIARNIAGIHLLNTNLRVLQYIIMPDHVHLLLRVLDTLDRHLGDYIGMFKVRTGQDYARRTGVYKTVFENDFYDCILYPSRSLNAIYEYIRDNPRRLAERREHPEYFQRVNDLVIDGKICRAYGNMQLLSNPFKDQVVIHRRYSAREREDKRRECLYTASNGGVLVSPFISAAPALGIESPGVSGRSLTRDQCLTMNRLAEALCGRGQSVSDKCDKN